MSQLTVLAQLVAKEDKVEEAKAALLALVPITEKEEGFINYDLHQDNDNPRHFFLYENWESPELLEKHLAAPHLVAFKARIDELFAEPLKLTAATKL